MSTEEPRYPTRRYVRELATLPRRIRDLEAAVQENRQLNRRIAELTDIVAELLIPATERDEERLTELLTKFRADTFTP